MKRFIYLLTAALVTMSLSAAPVDQTTAMMKAQRFLINELYAGKLMSPAAIVPVLLKAETGEGKVADPVYYIYNTPSNFIVVAGDDRAEEILMVGDHPLPNVSSIPPGLQDLLGQYRDQIMFLQRNPNLRPNLLLPSGNGRSLRSGVYGPLLTSNWDQSAPYNNQLKFLNYQCLTGCPATSAAMVFHYWKYPTAATPDVPGYESVISYSSYGTKSYTHPALPSTTFDWANMLDSYASGYTTAQSNAVATLMHYVGQAERMEYGTSSAGGSGVNVDSVGNICDAFTFFGYDASSARTVKKTSAYSGGTTLYSDTEWAAMIQEEMSAGRPVVFCAVSTTGGGHSFNIDGYNSSTGKYHVNFGWSGTGNGWCALNSFGYNTYNFSVYQQMVIGIQPPASSTIPRITVTPSTLGFNTVIGGTETKTFTVTGINLTDDIDLQLTDANGVYSVSPSTISASAAASGATVTVTYMPCAAGTHMANVKLLSNGAAEVGVSMTGNAQPAAIETYTPVMTAPTANDIIGTGFRATWTDETPNANVVSYTLQVNEKSTLPTANLIYSIDLANVQPVKNSDGYLTDISAYLNGYLGGGWTSLAPVFANTGMLITGGILESPDYNISGTNKVTVKVTANSYYSSNYGSTTLKVGTKVDSRRQALTDNGTEYTFVLNCMGSDRISIGSIDNIVGIRKIEIFAGNASFNSPIGTSETGSSTMRTITGITDKSHIISNLDTTGTFVYKVKAVYINGTESAWSNTQEIDLSPDEPAGPPTLTVTPASLGMSAYAGEMSTATFRVTGTDLTDNVMLTMSGVNVFGISTSSITATDAMNGVDVTVTYAPTAVGTHNAAINVSTEGAEAQVVSLTGTATKAPSTKYVPVMSAPNADHVTSSGFRAEWADQTASSKVSSYTLMVSGPGTPAQPTTTLLGTVDGSKYPGSYSAITLKSPWGGNSVMAGNNAIYINRGGMVTFTIPAGYDNATFSVQITTVTNSYGSGNFSVKSTRTSSAGHTFSRGETYTWVVSGSAGDVITISSTASNYSPDMAMINVYAGNVSLNASAERTITGITSKYYNVTGLDAGTTYTYKVKTIYADGTVSAWSNEQTVTTGVEEPDEPTAKYDPVMSAPNGDYITSSSFRAAWTDQTASANVLSYTLMVGNQNTPAQPTTTLLGTLDGNDYPDSYAAVTLPAPWGGSNVMAGNNAFYLSRNGKITYTIPAGYDNATFSLQITTVTNSYGAGNFTVGATNSSMTSHTFAAGETYTWVVRGSAGDVISISSPGSSYSADVAMIKVYAGNASLNAAGEITITGITGKFYDVNGLDAGTTYNYKVKAVYTDGTESAWSNEQTVTTRDDEPAPTPTLTVTPASLNMAANLGGTQTATFKVTGTDLTGNVALSVSGADVFGISTSSISAANAEGGVNVTVTYAPTVAGTQTATVTVASQGAQSKTVTLTGTATVAKATPVIGAATGVGSSAFTANWTHNVPNASVSSYTLHVNLDSMPDTPDEPEITPIAVLDGSQYTGSYKSVTLRSPWGGSSVKGGNGVLYFTNSWLFKGQITYTIPAGYNNATFTVKITTLDNNNGKGNITVKSARTSAVGHTFAAGESYSWTVTGSSNNQITITSSNSSNSPYMTLIEIYEGTPSFNASVTGGDTAIEVTGINPGTTSFTVDNLIAGATYSYYVVANYVDGTTATSGSQEVTLVSLTLNDDTGLGRLFTDEEIESVTYVNMAGLQSKEPWNGINIIVTRYKSGAVTSTKKLF